MSDISASERRLSAALDRIEYGIERMRAEALAAAEAAPEPPAALTARAPAPAPEPDRLDGDMAALHRRQAAALERAQQRLAAAGAEAARLAAANDRLLLANRALIEAGDDDFADAVHLALQAEIEALRAARAAEIAQMGDILAALETMLGIPETAPLPPDSAPADEPGLMAEDVTPAAPEGRVLRFGAEDTDEERG